MRCVIYNFITYPKFIKGNIRSQQMGLRYESSKSQAKMPIVDQGSAAAKSSGWFFFENNFILGLVS